MISNQSFNAKISNFLDGDLMAASILEAIFSWINFNQKNGTNFREGHFWTYNTAEAWTMQLGFCTVKQFYKKISKLRDAGLIYTKKFNSEKGDQTLWYTVNKEKYYQIVNETYQGDDDNIQPPSKHRDSKQDDSSLLNSEGEMASDFPAAENSIITTISIKKKKKKKEIRRRGWYMPPNHEDYNSWSVSDHLKGKLKREYDLTDDQIEDAYKEFVLYNNAMGTKIRSIVAMFTLWCKRFSAKLKKYVRKTRTAFSQTIKKITTPCKVKIMQCINHIKDEWAKSFHLVLLNHYGLKQYQEFGLIELKAVKKDTENGAIEVDFVNAYGVYLPDGIHKLRSRKTELLEILTKANYQINKLRICGI